MSRPVPKLWHPGIVFVFIDITPFFDYFGYRNQGTFAKPAVTILSAANTNDDFWKKGEMTKIAWPLPSVTGAWNDNQQNEETELALDQYKKAVL